MNAGSFAVASVLMLGGSACLPHTQVAHSADPTLEPSLYATYGVIPQRVGDDRLNADAQVVVRSAIRRVMTTRGFEEAEPSQADLRVSYKVVAQARPRPVAPRLIDEVGTVQLAGAFGNLVPNDVAPPSMVKKLLMVQLQDAETLEIVWVGWSRNEVISGNLVTSTSDLIGRILSRLPYRSEPVARGYLNDT